MNARYPWPTYQHPWEAEVLQVRLDGSPRPDVVDAHHMRIRTDTAPEWRRLAVSLSLRSGEPPREGAQELQSHLLLSCPRTQTRLSVPACPGIASGTFTAEMDLPRDVFAGTATLIGQITGVVNGRRRVLGVSRPWTVVVDGSEAPIPAGAPPFTTIWIDFGAEEAPAAARANPSAHAFMDVSTIATLYLNTGIPGLQPLLHADRARLERRRLRDVLGAGIAQYAMATLVRTAVHEVSATDDGVPESPQDHLLRQVLDAVARAMPSVASTEDLLQRIVSAESSSFERTALWGEIDVAVQTMTGLAETIASITDEVRHA